MGASGDSVVIRKVSCDLWSRQRIILCYLKIRAKEAPFKLIFQFKENLRLIARVCYVVSWHHVCCSFSLTFLVFRINVLKGPLFLLRYSPFSLHWVSTRLFRGAPFYFLLYYRADCLITSH